MGEARFDSEESFESSPAYAAAVMCRIAEGGNLHAGLLYKLGKEVRVLHLGWENDLKNTWRWPRLWAAPDLKSQRSFALSALCTRIWKKFEKDKTMPYGLGFYQSTFTDTGLRLNGKAVGLSCATFILAVFNKLGLALVEEETWPVRQENDNEWYDRLSDENKAQVPDLKAEIDSRVRRIRPEEVLGACSCDAPAQFTDCEAHGKRYVEMLDKEEAARRVTTAAQAQEAAVEPTTLQSDSANLDSE